MKKLLIPLAITALALVGCTKDATFESKKIEIVDPNPPAEDPDVISFQSYLPAKFTKSTMWYSTQKVNWNVDDDVFITDGTYSAVYTALKGGKDSTLLNHFAGDTLAFAQGTEYQAYFPSEIADFNGVKGDFGLPAVRTYAGFDRMVDMPMVAQKVRTVADGVQELPQDTLKFKNLCGLICFMISEPQAVINTESNLQLKNIQFTASTPLCGKGKITLGDNPSIVLDPSNEEILTLNCNKEVRLATTATPIYIAVPEGTYKDVVILYNAVNGKQYITYVLEDIVVNRGSVTTVNNVELALKPEDIQISQTSNCMVVYTVGNYLFKPTKAETGESIGEVDHAVLLWESLMDGTSVANNMVISKIGYDAKKDSISFMISSFPTYGGNALIGAADKNGKILWSYHIWLQRTASKIPSPTDPGVFAYDQVNGKYQIMNVSMGGTGIVSSNSGLSPSLSSISGEERILSSDRDVIRTRERLLTPELIEPLKPVQFLSKQQRPILPYSIRL